MDADLYDEFGNYIGPDLESEEEEDDDFEQYNAPNDDDEDEGVQNNVSPIGLVFIILIYKMTFKGVGGVER